jgi:hypothetical protein
MSEEKEKSSFSLWATMWPTLRASVRDTSPDAVAARRSVLKEYGKVFLGYGLLTAALVAGDELTPKGTVLGRVLMGVFLLYVFSLMLAFAARVCALQRRLDYTEKRLNDLLHKKSGT